MNNRLTILEARCDRLKRMLKDSGVLTTKLVLDLYSEGKLTLNDVRYLLDVLEDEDVEVKDEEKTCGDCKWFMGMKEEAYCGNVIGMYRYPGPHFNVCSGYEEKEEDR